MKTWRLSKSPGRKFEVVTTRPSKLKGEHKIEMKERERMIETSELCIENVREFRQEYKELRYEHRGEKLRRN